MAAVNRYRFSQKTIDSAKAYLKDKKGAKPSFLNKYTGTVKNGKLYLDDKLVVPKDRVETYLRNKILKGTTPLSRDAAFYWISKKTIGVSRAAVDSFLKKQRVIRETDNQQATTKRPKQRVNTKGQLHIDLVEIKFKDFPFDPIVPRSRVKLTAEERAEGEDEGDVKKGYFFGCVDSLTSLAWYKFAKFKNYKVITPIAKECFQWMSQQLGVPMNKLTLKSDMGAEFDWAKYKTWGLKTFTVKSDPFIEAKNSHFQRILFRVAKMNTTRNINRLCEMAVTQMNRTVSSVSKKAPVENVRESTKKLAETYNKKRGKGSGVKIHRRPLVPGKDKVRIQLVFEKDKPFHKAYSGKMWSGRLYKVTEKRGNRYRVNRKLYHRDELRLTEEYDEKTEKLLRKREKAL